MIVKKQCRHRTRSRGSRFNSANQQRAQVIESPAFWCVRRCKLVSAQAAAAEEAVLWDLTVKVVDACHSLGALLHMVRLTTRWLLLAINERMW